LPDMPCKCFALAADFRLRVFQSNSVHCADRQHGQQAAKMSDGAARLETMMSRRLMAWHDINLPLRLSSFQAYPGIVCRLCWHSALPPI